jgi:hypothetical protein
MIAVASVACSSHPAVQLTHKDEHSARSDEARISALIEETLATTPLEEIYMQNGLLRTRIAIQRNGNEILEVSIAKLRGQTPKKSAAVLYRRRTQLYDCARAIIDLHDRKYARTLWSLWTPVSDQPPGAMDLPSERRPAAEACAEQAIRVR